MTCTARSLAARGRGRAGRPPPTRPVHPANDDVTIEQNKHINTTFNQYYIEHLSVMILHQFTIRKSVLDVVSK